MNILIVANHYAVCSARYAADAFVRLGHSVKHVGTPMGRNIWGAQVPREYVWEPDNLVIAFDSTLAEDLRPYEDAGREIFRPDVILVMDSDPAVLDNQRDAPDDVPHIVWGVDNHVRDYRRPYFDHYFLAHKSVSVMPWTSNKTGEQFDYVDDRGVQYRTTARQDMTWLPCAYDPVAFPPSPIPWAERAYDVCMIGVMYERRWLLVNAMRDAGLKVLAGTGLVYDAYRDAYHNSRVALVSSFNGDLPIRLFEGAGMGCAVLCDGIQDLDIIDITAPIWQYSDREEAITMARDLQDEPIVVELVAAWSRQHTWDARAQVIIDWLEGRK